MQMTNEDFAQWKSLVHYIISKHFSWAYDSKRGAGIHYKHKLDYDDLVSEGYVALVKSHSGYNNNGKAKFMTYAYKSIFRAVSKFINANLTPVTIRDLKKLMSQDKDSLRRRQASSAIGCMFFSEMSNSDSDDGKNWQDGIEDASSGEQSGIAEHKEWVKNCIEKLKGRLETREYRILLWRANDISVATIAARTGMTREGVNKLYNNILVKAAAILLEEEEMMND